MDGEHRIQFELIACDDLHMKDYNTETDITIASGDSNQENRDSHTHTKHVFFCFFFIELFLILYFFFISIIFKARTYAPSTLYAFSFLIARDHADTQGFVLFFFFFLHYFRLMLFSFNIGG